MRISSQKYFHGVARSVYGTRETVCVDSLFDESDRGLGIMARSFDDNAAAPRKPTQSLNEGKSDVSWKSNAMRIVKVVCHQFLIRQLSC